MRAFRRRGQKKKCCVFGAGDLEFLVTPSAPRGLSALSISEGYTFCPGVGYTTAADWAANAAIKDVLDSAAELERILQEEQAAETAARGDDDDYDEGESREIFLFGFEFQEFSFYFKNLLYCCVPLTPVTGAYP